MWGHRNSTWASALITLKMRYIIISDYGLIASLMSGKSSRTMANIPNIIIDYWMVVMEVEKTLKGVIFSNTYRDICRCSRHVTQCWPRSDPRMRAGCSGSRRCVPARPAHRWRYTGTRPTTTRPLQGVGWIKVVILFRITFKDAISPLTLNHMVD